MVQHVLSIFTRTPRGSGIYHCADLFSEVREVFTVPGPHSLNASYNPKHTLIFSIVPWGRGVGGGEDFRGMNLQNENH